MQHRLLIATLTLFVVGIVAIVSLSYFQVLRETESISFENLIPKPQATPKKEHASSWMSRFSAQKIPDYIYPTQELHVKLIFPTTPLDILKTFHVLVNEMSDYQFFCLNQVLLAHKIEYSYHKTGGRVQLVITTQNEEYLRNVLKELQRYEITYKIHQS